MGLIFPHKPRRKRGGLWDTRTDALSSSHTAYCKWMWQRRLKKGLAGDHRVVKIQLSLTIREKVRKGAEQGWRWSRFHSKTFNNHIICPRHETVHAWLIRLLVKNKENQKLGSFNVLHNDISLSLFVSLLFGARQPTAALDCNHSDSVCSSLECPSVCCFTVE